MKLKIERERLNGRIAIKVMIRKIQGVKEVRGVEEVGGFGLFLSF
jgi:hypothetical protein